MIIMKHRPEFLHVDGACIPGSSPPLLLLRHGDDVVVGVPVIVTVLAEGGSSLFPRRSLLLTPLFMVPTGIADQGTALQVSEIIEVVVLRWLRLVSWEVIVVESVCYQFWELPVSRPVHSSCSS